ncbi:hypothetical protein D3C73_173780 [compost metagenome]|jgi:hypothetical protein
MSIYSQSPDQMVRELINNANTPLVPFAPENLTFGTPQVVTGNPSVNATVKVRGIQGEVYAGQVAISYNRLDLGVLYRGNYRPEFTALGQSTLYRLLPEINKALGLNLTKNDLIDVDLKLLEEGDQVNLELRAKPGSLAYTGLATILFNRRQLMLTDVLPVEAFEEFKHADPVLEGYQSAGLLTWGQDFTIIAQYLKVNRYGNNYKGSWIDEAGLRAGLAQYFGIENWPRIDTSANSKMTIRDYATKDHPDANRNYQRVVVQTSLRSDGYSGTAFFHYNA